MLCNILIQVSFPSCVIQCLHLRWSFSWRVSYKDMKKSTRKQVCQISNTSSSMNRICTCTENRDNNPVYENSFKILMITYSHSLNSFLIYIYREREREHWWEQNIFCSFTTPQVFWQSSAPGASSTLVTSVVLYSFTRATLMSPGKDETRVCG